MGGGRGTWDLLERTREFALRIVRLYGALPGTVEARVMGKQVLRSGTSVGWNEFRHRQSGAQPAQELQIFDVAGLHDTQPVRGFPREKHVGTLASAYQAFLKAREAQRRRLNLRHLDRIGEKKGD